MKLDALNFRYAIQPVKGRTPPWLPSRVFDGGPELVNYRVRQNWMIVDRLFAAAELRLGDKHSEQRVRIVRTDGRKS